METVWFSKVANFLDTSSVARLLLVDGSAKKAFEVAGSYNVWMTCAEQEFPELVAKRSLYEGEHCTTILGCQALCRRANHAMDSTLYLNDVEAASSLARQLRNAYRACRAHRALTGFDAHVLYGLFDLDESSSGTLFRCGAEHGTSIGGLPPGFLKVAMSLDGDNKLLVSAMYAASIASEFTPLAQAHRVRGTMDVASADPGMAMCFRSVPLVLDGCWRSSMIGSVRSRDNFEEDSGKVFLCVLTLMEGGLTRRDISVLSALNLDVLRLRQ
eukprot:TRINITY_DN65699_c0_g1_i1.p1 TRINITY_DN65699_c0_g1~~TRINITY_DN65699_c0_g1_i1.p1  ORF type:complete len:271 (+),score=44.08 TRINITY_DN65699_c0_g1_i1:92-904(+)